MTTFGVDENKYNLFVNCDFFVGQWPRISNWLGFSTTFQGKSLNNLLQFGGLDGLSKNVQLSLNTI